MKLCYVPKKFTRGHANTIQRANTILEEYAAQNFVLTLRQLYYQFVARGFIPNNQKSYKRLGSIMGEARLAGKVDWEHMEDRSRNLSLLQHYDGPQDALNKLVNWYHTDLWANQPYRPEVWIEKDALSGVIAGVCEENDVPYFSCRGYTSLSEMWRASLRLRRHLDNGQTPFIVHLGDHDPSGIDMSRDITDRLNKTFMSDCRFKRVALNMDQVEEYQPPPNPAKTTDSRYKAYIAQFGNESWELDALEPSKFRELILDELNGIRNEAQWKQDVAAKEAVRARLKEVSKDWENLARYKTDLEQAKADMEALDLRLADRHRAVAKRDKQITDLKREVEELQADLRKAKRNGRGER